MKILGEENPTRHSEERYEFLKREGFPDLDEGTQITQPEEFRRILQEQKPEVVYARMGRYDDLALGCDFFIRLLDGSVFKIRSYMPSWDKQGNVTPKQSHYSVLSDFPYKYVGYDEYTGYNNFEGNACKFFLQHPKT